MTLATKITAGRIVLIPFFVGALLYYQKSGADGVADEQMRWWAAGFFTVAALSDALDGFIARRYGQKSRLGAVLDPLADKGLMLSAIITLSLINVPGFLPLPIWFFVLVLGRDALMLATIVVLRLYVGEVEIRPHWTGKVCTAFQLGAVGLVLVQGAELLTRGVILAAGVFTGVTFLVYGARVYRMLSVADHAHPGSLP